MPINLWRKEEDDIIKNKYCESGANIYKELGRSRKAVINRAYVLGIKTKVTKKVKFCIKCGKKINPYYKNITLCKNCSAKKTYKQRGAFSHNNSKMWTNEDIIILKKNYHNKLNSELSLLLNRNESSIQHKANRLNLHKSKVFWRTNPTIINKLFKSKNNPTKNKEVMDKIKLSLKRGYKNGSIKLSGIALKSKMGLTKKENHPNWLGGKSFEPYDKNFDKTFCRYIRKRDNNVCMVCNKTNEQELLNIKKSLSIHHIDYNKKNTCKENCISLCDSCHMKTNYNRSSWIKFFQTLMSDRYGYDYEYN